MSAPVSRALTSVEIVPLPGGCRVKLNWESLVNTELKHGEEGPNYPEQVPRDRFFSSIHDAVGYIEQVWRFSSGLSHAFVLLQ